MIPAQVFYCELCETCENKFFAEHLRTAGSSYISINSSERKLASKTVNYETLIKAYRFELEVGVMKNVNPREETGLICVFKEGA